MPTTPKQFKPYWLPERPEGRQTTANTKFYQSMPWRRLRAYKIKSMPVCEQCLRNNKHTQATDVDHILPINQANPFDTNGGMYGRPLDISNLQSLCKKCHNAKSGREAHK